MEEYQTARCPSCEDQKSPLSEIYSSSDCKCCGQEIDAGRILECRTCGSKHQWEDIALDVYNYEDEAYKLEQEVPCDVDGCEGETIVYSWVEHMEYKCRKHSEISYLEEYEWNKEFYKVSKEE